MSAGAILGGASIGAGVGLSSVALMPFNAANTFLGSAFFGYGMILGERYMYQADWPKIQARLEHGEKIENIIQEYTGVFTAVVMKEAKIIFDSVSGEFARIMSELLGLKPTQDPVPPPPTTTPPVPPPIIGGISQPPVEVPQVIVDVMKHPENVRQMRSPNKYAIGRTRHRKVSAGGGMMLEANLAHGTGSLPLLGRWHVISSLNNLEKILPLANSAWPVPAYFRWDKSSSIKYWFPNKAKHI